MYFSLLESRMGAFHIFMLGWSFVRLSWAVFHWVLLLCVEAPPPARNAIRPGTWSSAPRAPTSTNSVKNLHTGCGPQLLRLNAPGVAVGRGSLPQGKGTQASMKTLPFSSRGVPVFRGIKLVATAHPEVLQGVHFPVTPVARNFPATCLAALERDKPGRGRSTDVKASPAGPAEQDRFALGRNYVEHGPAEFNNPTPKQPLIFLKPPSSLVLAPDDPVVPAPGCWAAWIFERRALPSSFRKNAPSLRDGDDVRPYIAGYTCLKRR